MNKVFKELLDVCIVVYLDNILIYSDNPADHLQHVCEVLRHLCEHDLFAKVEKCAFSVDTTDFLGFIIGPDSLCMDDSKIQVICNWPTPWKVKDMQSFLGFTNFYHQFIAAYSDITVLLTRLMRKDVPWKWLLLCEDTFQLLKTVFTSAPILHHFDPSLPPIVETDMSDYAINTILSLQTNDGDIHLVAFYSHTLLGAQLNYDTHDKELLAIFQAFKTWQHYLKSPHHMINMITDHKNLEYFSSMKMLTCHQACWLEYLSAFNLVICFRPGKLGEKPNSLTCQADYYLKGGDRDYTLANLQNLRPIFTQEHLATSLRTTRLCKVALDAASLVDSSILILDSVALLEDIKAGLTINPLANRELERCLKGNPSPRFTLSSSRSTSNGPSCICPRLQTQLWKPSHLRATGEARPPNSWPLQLQQDIGTLTSQLHLAQHAHGQQELCCTMHPLRMQQAFMPSPLWTSATITNPRMPLAFHQHGLHQTATSLQWVYRNSGGHRLPF
jgi:hypothetical protein